MLSTPVRQLNHDTSSSASAVGRAPGTESRPAQEAFKIGVPARTGSYPPLVELVVELYSGRAKPVGPRGGGVG